MHLLNVDVLCVLIKSKRRLHMFILNFIRTYAQLTKYRNSFNIHLPPLFMFNLDPELNDGAVALAGLPPFVPGIICYPENGKIYYNKTFTKLLIAHQNAFFAHEHGHIAHNHLVDKQSEGTRKDPLYYEYELQADLYSYNEGHDMLGALMHVMVECPVLFDYKRLHNLAKHTNQLNRLPRKFKFYTLLIKG